MDETRRILVIDDNQDIHRDFRKVLALDLRDDRELQDLEAELFGGAEETVAEAPEWPVLEIDSAYQGEQGIEMAVAAARQGRPYLMAFVDVRMPPGIDGVQTIKRMWEQLPELQCVICTAYSDYQWEDICLELKNSANLLILKKPFDTVEVLQVVRALSEKAELAHKARTYQEELEQKIRHLIRIETELRQNNEELKTARAAADESNRAKGEFLANISHELRTPLNGVIGMSDLLLSTSLDRHQRKYASTIKTSGELLLDLLNEILDFSKIEAGKLELEEINFDLLEAIETVIQVVAHKCQQKGLELSYFLDPDVPRVLRGDPNRVRQILINLTNNAVKFTEHGEVGVQVSRAATKSGECTIRFAVTDTGVGIPQDRRNRLFKSFSQVDASTTRKYGGTGLGLAICKELCVRMGGEIGFESEVGKGSTFWFRLPLRKPAGRDCGQDAVPPQLRGLRALAVDDSDAARENVRKQLAAWGIEVEVAASGAEALDRLRHASDIGRPFQIALVDVDMPHMSGRDLARAIRSDRRLQDVMLLAILPLGASADANELERFGFCDCVTKPLMQSELLNSLMNAAAAAQSGSAAGYNALPSKTVSTPPSMPTTRRPGARILVAEDNEINQRVATAILTRFGFQCEVVNNGREAIDALRASEYDVVLMDMQMPEMDGLEAARAIRTGMEGLRPEAQRVPIIALTANAMKRDRDQCLQAGMNSYVSKPFDPLKLLEEIESYLVDLDRPPEETSDVATLADAEPSPEPDEATIAEPPVDREMLLSHCMGDAALAADLLARFQAKGEDELKQLAAAVTAGDLAETVRLAHYLKGVAGNLAITRLRAAAERLEMLGRAGRTEGAENIVEEMRNHWRAFREFTLEASVS